MTKESEVGSSRSTARTHGTNGTMAPRGSIASRALSHHRTNSLGVPSRGATTRDEDAKGELGRGCQLTAKRGRRRVMGVEMKE